MFAMFSMFSKAITVTVTIALATLTLHRTAPDVARACAVVVMPRVSPEEWPSLATEKVLIVHDAERGKQHFVREVAFRRASQRFGFVVPTPTRPEVAAVEKTPFTALRNAFDWGGAHWGAGGLGTLGRGGGDEDAPAGVEVLEEKKVGSFTAFVLAATDHEALAKWLRDNGLVSRPEADAWLRHYVQMEFFYVAMRYDPPIGAEVAADRPVEAETIRVSFDTPIPYYPYVEPAGSGTASPRVLELWYAGVDRVNPIALRDKDGEQEWVRPLKPGAEYPQARVGLVDALEPELEAVLPEGDLVVQTFRDFKPDRAGFDDILFGAYDPEALSEERRAALERFLPILDPQLGEASR